MSGPIFPGEVGTRRKQAGEGFQVGDRVTIPGTVDTLPSESNDLDAIMIKLDDGGYRFWADPDKVGDVRAGDRVEVPFVVNFVPEESPYADPEIGIVSDWGGGSLNTSPEGVTKSSRRKQADIVHDVEGSGDYFWYEPGDDSIASFDLSNAGDRWEVGVYLPDGGVSETSFRADSSEGAIDKAISFYEKNANRHKKADMDYMYRDLAYKFYDWLADKGFSGEELASDDFDWEEVDRMVPQFAQENGVTVEDVSEATAQYAPGGPGFFARRKNAAWRPSGGGTVTNMKSNGSFAEVYPPNSEQNSGSGFEWSVFSSSGSEIDHGMEGSMAAAKRAAGAILRSASNRKTAVYAEPDEMVAIWDYVEWCKDNGLNPKDRDNLEAFVDAGMMSYLNDEYSYDDIERYIDGELEIDLDRYPFLAKALRKATKKENNMHSRRRQAEFGRNDQGEWEDTQISQTPPAEPAVDPSEGGDAPNSTNEQRVKREDPDNNQLAAIEKMERELRAMKRQLTARPIGEMKSDEGGGDVRREDLYEEYEDPSPKDAAYQAKRNDDFVAWVSKEHGKKLTEAKSLGELRSWARSYSRLAKIDVSELHEVVSKVAAGKREAAKARQAELEKGDQKPAPRQARRKHQPRRRRVAKRPAQAATRKQAIGYSDLSEEELFEEWLLAEYDRRPEDVSPEDRDLFYNEFLDGGGVVDWEKLYAKRKKAETAPADDLNVAAPDDRINVEKPTQNVTDDEAQESQFDKGDFGNNAGDDIAKPDRSLDHQWLPGEGRKSSRQTPKGHETVRLAEAYVAAGLADPSERWKLATDFEGMDRSVILDRTALLERVATVTAATQKKTAGNFGASMRSAVPPNLAGGGGAAVTASADAGDSDTDFFLMK